jgi:hypothetical protein
LPLSGWATFRQGYDRSMCFQTGKSSGQGWRGLAATAFGNAPQSSFGFIKSGEVCSGIFKSITLGGINPECDNFSR